jgi:putative sugar O-methyltransferase
VIELGAGFGRTAHVLLSAFEHIERYRIVDLPETLSLSRRYLENVLSTTQFEKLQFVDAEDVVSVLPSLHEMSHLAIQIDGLQEMKRSTIDC